MTLNEETVAGELDSSHIGRTITFEAQRRKVRAILEGVNQLSSYTHLRFRTGQGATSQASLPLNTPITLEP